MKKLMMTLAAALSATALMAEVTSKNVVGYQTVTLTPNKFTHVSPTFIKVGGAAQVTLAELKGDFAEMDSIQFMNALSATASEYFWLVEGSGSPGASGWFAADFETPAGNTVIGAGNSVLYSSQGATSLLFSGEVNAQSVDIVTGAGFTPAGNPFPVNTTLSAISFVGISEMCSVQIMSDIAATAAEYFWLVEGSGSPGASGWFANDFETPAGDTVIAAGMGFLFSEQGTSTTITFASPL
jgi:hypothetical protein